MMTLLDISYETIRQNWTQYKDTIQDDDNLWKDWQQKTKIDNTNIYLPYLKLFIQGQNVHHEKPFQNGVLICQQANNTLIIKGMCGYERKEMHRLCDKIGLHHESKVNPKNKNKKHFYIYKPTEWLWEFTERNPYSENPEVYEHREIESKKKREAYEERMRRKYCCVCGENGMETELFYSPYYAQLYCIDCLEITSDRDGGIMSDHKYEPI
jgi:hypothetical protein